MPYYPFSEFKSISNTDQRLLQDLDEARGQLLRVNLIEGYCIAVFSWGEIALPLELESKLRGLVGKKSGILRLDGRYYVKELEKGHA